MVLPVRLVHTAVAVAAESTESLVAGICFGTARSFLQAVEAGTGWQLQVPMVVLLQL